jgi:hypothetical protein
MSGLECEVYARRHRRPELGVGYTKYAVEGVELGSMEYGSKREDQGWMDGRMDGYK